MRLHETRRRGSAARPSRRPRAARAEVQVAARGRDGAENIYLDGTNASRRRGAAFRRPRGRVTTPDVRRGRVPA